MKPLVIKDAKSIDIIADSMPNRTICPIFSVSNVSGTGIELLKLFISKLPNIEISNDEDKEVSSG